MDTRGAAALRAHHLPLSTHRPIPGRGRVLLAGDALSLINPFTGEGIFYAILSGALAGTAAARAGLGAARVYTEALRRRLGRHLRHSRVASVLGERTWVVDAAVRAAQADQHVFDAIIEVGLGDGLLNRSTVTAIARNIR